MNDQNSSIDSCAIVNTGYARNVLYNQVLEDFAPVELDRIKKPVNWWLVTFMSLSTMLLLYFLFRRF